MNKLFRVMIILLLSGSVITGCKESLDTPLTQEATPTEKSLYLNENLLSKFTERYTVGDFHQHTTYSDGSWSIGHVMGKDNYYNLDWWVNSEHGGAFNRDGAVSGNDLGTSIIWTSYIPNPVKGKPNGTNMWRWQSIAEYSFLEVLKARSLYPSKTIIQGLEWNVPGHEHASTGILNNQFIANPNANPVAEFEYKFDNSDTDNMGGLNNWVKSTNSGHSKTLEGIAWMQANYKNTSWVVPAHPERKGLYKINDLRDMNNAGPDVCFGFESMPGHQKSAERGEYKKSSNTYGTCTYGGTGAMAAKVGGLWDAMLSEGRNWWLFASSDFHDVINDFYPGEYQKTYVAVAEKNDPQAIIDGLRSGNSFVVAGDLIDCLDFTVGGKTMGQTAKVNGNNVLITIYVHDPATSNNNTYSSYTNPVLDHIDLIAGKVSGKIDPSDPNYKNDDVSSTTKVVARFDKSGGIADSNGLVSSKWNDLGNGLIKITYLYSNVKEDMYFRLRGTNLGINVANQTDGAGNPLADDLLSPNTAAKTFDDLWFYSNPVFVKK